MLTHNASATTRFLTEKQIAKAIREAAPKTDCYLVRGSGTDKARIFSAKTQHGKLRVRCTRAWIAPSAGCDIVLYAAEPRETVIRLAADGGSYV